MERRSVDELLSIARARLDRVSPSELEAEVAAGALVVDTRPVEQRERDGDLPGALVIDRNVLEWRLDPVSATRIPQTGYDVRIVLVCNEGYSSSLVAATLQDLGLSRATDLVGGFQAWLALRAEEHKPLKDRAERWDRVYTDQDETAVSWFQSKPSWSLELLDALGVEPNAAVVDVGAGASRFVDALLDRGFVDVTVLDVAAAALAVAQRRLGRRAEQIQWITADLLAWHPERTFDVWHDRATFHFLVDPAEKARYVQLVESCLNVGGHAVIATFAPDGPDHCSGLPTARYDAKTLIEVFGSNFDVVETRREEHRTPVGSIQPFTWTALVRSA
jgi:rhodanese-related sulfurtransferase/2-polyprenyl-3-methyl-5-hydroxy-6-metoxy-1,4-benzoquinol methylase